jgi:hypothetical protein
MSHYVSAINKNGAEITSLSMSMGRAYKETIYDLFDAMEYYAGVSGDGTVVKYNRSDAEHAKSKLNKLSNRSRDKGLEMCKRCEGFINDILNSQCESFEIGWF